MTRASSVVFGLALGCGPLVAVDEGTGEDSGSRDDDHGGDDRPGTGPRPATMTTPESGPDDGEGEGEVDEGWKPDFGGGEECDESAIASCYSVEVIELGYEALQMVVEDVTGDDVRDLVVAASYNIVVHPGQGGSFGDLFASPTGLEAPRGVAIADLTGDGNADAVFIAESTSLSFAVGDGFGGFVPTQEVSLPGLPMQVRAHDIDGDGWSEPIVALQDGTIAIVRGIGGPMPPTEIYDSGIWDVESFEVGGLGLAGPADDLVVAGLKGDQALITVADYEQAVGDQWEQSPFRGDTVGLAVRDLDGDGMPDVATARAMGSESEAIVFPGLGDGVFAAPNAVGLGATASAVAGGRFGPGLEGVVAIVDGTPTVVIFELELATPLTNELARGPLAVGDYNGDDISDILAPTSDGYGILALWSGA